MTAYDLISIANAVVITVVVYRSASTVRFTRTRFAHTVYEHAVSSIRRSAVVVASQSLLAAYDFISVAHAVVIAVVVHNCARAIRFTGTRFTDPIHKCASTVIHGGRSHIVACSSIHAT